MVTISFYDSKISRQHRPANISVLNNIRPSRTLQVDGCDVTNTSSYIDVETPNDRDWTNLLYASSYIGVTNSNTDMYYCFVDRVEPNNFNTSKRYFRIYFTIDWWTTLLYRFDENSFSDIIGAIDGDVERAHVDDCDRAGNVILDNTTLEAEEDVPDFRSYGVRLQLNGYSEYNNYDLKWRYILFTFDDDLVASGDEIRTMFHSGNLESSTDENHNASACPCGVCFIPEISGKSVEFIIEYIDSETGATRTVGYPADITASIISDPRVVHSFVTTIPPCSTQIFEREDGSLYVYASSYKSGGRLTDNNIGKVRLSYGVDPLWNYTLPQLSDIEGYYSWGYSAVNNNFSYIPSDRSPIITATTPDDYAEYFERGIVKARSEVYIPCVLSCNYETFLISQSKTKLFYKCMIDYEKGGVIVDLYTSSYYKSDVNTKIQLGQDRTFAPIKVLDRLKFWQGVLTGGLMGGESATKTAGTKVSAKTAGKVAGGYISLAASAINVISNALISQRGVSTSQPTSISQENNDGMPEFVISVPTNFESVKNRLLKYGYNTNNDFQSIWGQKRKYFNYIKMSGCSLTLPTLCTEAKLQIEEMFNNGVWLWNNVNAPAQDCKDGISRYNAIGYLYLNNYPIILDT